LKVTAPGGQIYYGNAFTNGVSVAGAPAGNTNIGSDWDTGGLANTDDRNNVECVFISSGSLQAGQYTVEVSAESVPTDAVSSTAAIDQDFALVLYNAVEDQTPPTFAGIQSVTDTGTGFSLDLAWLAASDPSTPITYNIYRATTSGGQNFAVPTASTTALTYTDTGLTLGTTYYYVVRAEDAYGNEDTNTVEKFGTPTDTQPPVFAGLQTVTNVGDGVSLDLSWNPATDATPPITYYIYRGTTPGGENFATPVGSTTLLTYRDSGLTEGTTYYYVVRARDGNGYEDTNTVEKNGTPESLLFFQVQVPFAGYKNLSLEPFEAAIQTTTSGPLDTVGAIRIDSANTGWVSQQYTLAQEMNGTWKFWVYGQVDRTTANGYLFAQVRQYSNNALLFQTGNDDEDIAGFVGAYHQFYWEYTVPAGTTLAANDRFYVQLYVDVTAETAGAASHQYTYSGVTQAGGPHDCYFLDLDDSTQAELTTPNGRYELTDTGTAAYSTIVTSDNTRADSDAFLTSSGTSDEWGIEYRYTITEDPAYITNIDFKHEGLWSVAGTGTAYAWNYATSTWDTIGATFPVSASVEETWVRSITSGFGNYLSGGQLKVIFYNTGANCDADIDYGECWVNYTIPATTFTFGYDNDATRSAVHPELVDVPSPPGFLINVTGASDGWIMISTPLVPGDTSLPTALNDLDGNTTWDRVLWYDPTAPAGARWKQYNTAWDSSLNDLTNVDHTMGVWIHIVSAGDGFIRVSGTDPLSTSISLYAGWNLIGYPATDDSTYTVGQLKTATGATYVEGFSATTYKTSVLLDTYVLKKGEAYWVYVPADTTWTVNW
ncbi:MAG: hypothetical protein AB1665_07725, partial [Candidatus Thermoplasmatota archaeon]